MEDPPSPPPSRPHPCPSRLRICPLSFFETLQPVFFLQADTGLLIWSETGSGRPTATPVPLTPGPHPNHESLSTDNDDLSPEGTGAEWRSEETSLWFRVSPAPGSGPSVSRVSGDPTAEGTHRGNPTRGNTRGVVLWRHESSDPSSSSPCSNRCTGRPGPPTRSGSALLLDDLRRTRPGPPTRGPTSGVTGLSPFTRLDTRRGPCLNPPQEPLDTGLGRTLPIDPSNEGTMRTGAPRRPPVHPSPRLPVCVVTPTKRVLRWVRSGD